MQSANTQRSFYQTLVPTGIDYYFAGTHQVLQSARPVVCAACLVILEDDPKRLSPSQHKILEGMLKVLDLKRDAFCVAWMASANIPPANKGPLQRGQHNKDLMEPLEQAILKYAPYSVLFLGSVIARAVGPKQSSETIITQTYSPQELEANPSHKRAAFDTLLHLKAQIQALCTSA